LWCAWIGFFGHAVIISSQFEINAAKDQKTYIKVFLIFKNAVKFSMTRYIVNMPKKIELSQEIVEEIKKLCLEDKLGARVIAKKIGVSRDVIRKVYKKEGIDVSSRNNKTSLTQNQIDHVKRLFNLGYGESRIAKDVKITTGKVIVAYRKLGLIASNSKKLVTSRDKKEIIPYNQLTNRPKELTEKYCSICDLMLSIEKFEIKEEKSSLGWTRYGSYCKKCISEVNKQKRNSEKSKKEKQEYFELHKTEIREKLNAAERKAYKEDIPFRLRKSISRMIRGQLKKNNSQKDGSCLPNLPYTIEQLKEHLQQAWEPWMNWENYGKYSAQTWDDNDSSTWTWNIDHIIPQSNLPFISMTDENFKVCWSLENLRPYSAKQNLIDGSNRIRHLK
jgi:hypothetical protein